MSKQTDFAFERNKLIGELGDVEEQYTKFSNSEKFDLAQGEAEVMMNLCRRLHLLDQQEQAEKTNNIV